MRDRSSEWFSDDLRRDRVLRDRATRWASCRRYRASLRLCREEAFREDAQDIYRWNEALPQRAECEHARDFSELDIQKVLCWGKEGLSPETRTFFRAAPFGHEGFDRAFHWGMIDRSDRFYPILVARVESLRW